VAIAKGHLRLFKLSNSPPYQLSFVYQEVVTTMAAVPVLFSEALNVSFMGFSHHGRLFSRIGWLT
jgi:hypothetical protein